MEGFRITRRRNGLARLAQQANHETLEYFARNQRFCLSSLSFNTVAHNKKLQSVCSKSEKKKQTDFFLLISVGMMEELLTTLFLFGCFLYDWEVILS